MKKTEICFFCGSKIKKEVKKFDIDFQDPFYCYECKHCKDNTEKTFYCTFYKKVFKRTKELFSYFGDEHYSYTVKRPKKCIKENTNV